MKKKRDRDDSLWCDQSTGKIYKIHPHTLEFPKSFPNKPLSHNKIFESEPIDNGTMVLFGLQQKDELQARICGHLINHAGTSLHGWMELCVLSPSGDVIKERIWAGITCEIYSAPSVKNGVRAIAGDIVAIFLTSPDIIDPDRSKIAIDCLLAKQVGV